MTQYLMIYQDRTYFLTLIVSYLRYQYPYLDIVFYLHSGIQLMIIELIMQLQDLGYMMPTYTELVHKLRHAKSF